ncbi:MAG: ABC transporter permease [Paraprevotella sp.]|jgi:putative ABC transport system permease protein|nr:ABC transporter permease [Paraprevotella sp.]
MGTIDLSYSGLGAGLLLMLIPFYFLWRYRTGMLGAAVLGTVRMTIQLLLIGVYLRFLFKWDSPWGNILWMTVMAIIASHTAVSRTSLKRRVLFLPVFVGFLVTVLLVAVYFLGVVMGLEDVFAARYFIPVVGLLFGNMLTVNIMAVNVYYSELYREQQTYYYLLGNGATRFEAQLPFLRSAVIKSFSPCIANMAVLGIVSFPGTMIGQILGGSMPELAIKYQLMISVITVVSSMISLVITIALSSRQTFDEYGRLLPIFRKDKATSKA